MNPTVTLAEPGEYRLAGPVTFDTVASLYESTQFDFVDDGELTIDLSKVSRVDSAGLALLLEWMRSSRQSNCRLRFTNIPEQLNSLMEVTGLDDVIASDSAIGADNL
ncbi:MAG: STAS domain-containing protein [Gammaproteobacteria bacterium]|nr:STAS domain-containing protein [Gammaproteobacteria bacterium]